MYGQHSLLVSCYILQYAVDYAVPPNSWLPNIYFLPCSSMRHMAGDLFFSRLLTQYCNFNFSTSLCVLSGDIPSSAYITTVLLAVLEHPSIYLAAASCIVCSCSINTFISIHRSVFVPKCEFLRTAFILSACVSPFPVTCALTS